MSAPFHVVLAGIAVPKFTRLMAHVHRQCGHRISYVVTSGAAHELLLGEGAQPADVHLIDERHVPSSVEPAQIEELGRLETAGVPTIHNMIMGDRVLSKLPYGDAVRYAVHLAQGFRAAFRTLRPSVVIGGHDAMFSAVAAAVARAEGIPWFGFNVSVIPIGYMALSPGIVPSQMVCMRDRSRAELDDLARRLLAQFEEGRLETPVYVSAHSVATAARRIPSHVRVAAAALKGQWTGRFERHTDYPVSFKAREYFRKRGNILRFPRSWFVDAAPAEPFLFFGFHRQPESTIDVYAPFHANQFAVVERIARATPPTHKLLVKLHIADADNYSRRQLQRLRQLPGVQLVRPNVPSRQFIDRCSAVVTIVGTMGLEAALLGKPVVAFGRMNYSHFPSVSCVESPEDLPEVIRRQLRAAPPSREAIVEAYREYLRPYFCATGPNTHARLGDWTQTEPSPEERAGFVELFQALENHVTETCVSSV